MPRINSNEAAAILHRLFCDAGVSSTRSERLAALYCQASRDGVYSHGLHMVPGLLKALRSGTIRNVNSDPQPVVAFGSLQRYDGGYGLGVLNAEWSMRRAAALAEEYGVGCVALRNTNHWGRAGNYGWLAAELGFLAVCWTNTIANMPSWGGIEEAVGNNPIVFAAPGPGERHLVLDMAMSQFSFGRLETHKTTGEPLPVTGGVDREGNPTKDAGAILDGGHAWPMGFWKGSGLAILLDAFAAVLSDGQDAQTITERIQSGEGEVGVSQVFLAFQPRHLGGRTSTQQTARIVEYLAQINPDSRYPGQTALAHRHRSDAEGIWVRDEIWDLLQSQLSG